MKKRASLLSVLLLFAVMTAFFFFNNMSESSPRKESFPRSQAEVLEEEASSEENSSKPEDSTQEVPPTTIKELKHTEHFTKGSLTHIFEGEINRQGNAVGYHTEALENTPGEVIPNTKNKPNEEGVYTAQVQVDGIKKAGNRGYSSFFPEGWDAQQVVDAINEAYENREWDNGNTYIGTSKEGVVIQMYLTEDDKIITAFPIY